MGVIVPQFNTDADGVVWTRGTAAPTGGKDGDRYLQAAAYPTDSGTIWRNYSGTWYAIGAENDWYVRASQNGWSILPGTNVIQPPAVNDTGAYTQVGGTLTRDAVNIDFAGSTSGAYWRQVISGGHLSCTMYGTATLSILPASAGTAAINIGVGNYYGPAYPYFTIDATTKAVTIEGTYATGVTAQANDTFTIVSRAGVSEMIIERAGVTIFSMLRPGFYTLGWAQDYGKAWNVSATGLLTAGKVSWGERAVVGV